MRLRVGTFCRLEFQGVEYRAGDEFDVPDESGAQWLSTGLVAPANGIWPMEAAAPPMPPPRPTESPTAKPAAKPGEYVVHELCQPPQSGRKSVCSVPSCPCQVPKGKCLECTRAQRRHRNKSAHQRAYRSKEWQRTRTAFLRDHPYCECEECAVIPEPLRPSAQVVDHIDGLGPLGPRAHDWANLRAMTIAHHNRRTMRDQVNGM